CNWKLDSSTASTSRPAGSMTASRIGVPTLPTACARSPAARRMDSSICTVVVLPFVPVTASHGAASRPRSRHASSTSPHSGRPRSRAAVSSGAVGRQPGEVTTRSTSSGSVAVAPGPSRIVAPSTSSNRACSRRRSSPSDSSSTSTSAPRCVRVSAAANPLTPNPATTARTPSQDESRSSEETSRSERTDDPLPVEESDAADDADAADDPEPDDDRDLGPALELEVVLQRSHPEDALAPGELEVADLQDHRERDDDEQATEHHEQQL